MKPCRRHLRAALTMALFSALCSVRAAGQEPVGFRVVVNPASVVTSIGRDELSKIFLRKTLAWRNGNAEAALPVDQRESSPVREAFTLWVHRRTLQAVLFYWQQQVFSGRGAPPPERSSDTSVMEYVAENPGAVGYVSPTAKLNGVKAIQVQE
jgi:ABC-type phosphate transport system substrate-binding protein